MTRFNNDDFRAADDDANESESEMLDRTPELSWVDHGLGYNFPESAEDPVVRRWQSNGVPFPQADRIDRIFTVVESVLRGARKEHLPEIFGFSKRQAFYYFDAARYLNFLDEQGHITKHGIRLVNASSPQSICNIVEEAMFHCPLLRTALLLLRLKRYDVDLIHPAELERLVASAEPPISGSTILRRVQTVRCWLRWIAENR